MTSEGSEYPIIAALSSRALQGPPPSLSSMHV
jgi:hypothetical protein